MNDITPSYLTAVASLKLINDSSILDITEDDYAFLTTDRPWISTERSRARRCVEATVYGALDLLGYPRFPAPAEFVAAAIAFYVHPVNIQTAALIMEGAEFSENIINGIEEPLKAQVIFAHVLRLRAGMEDLINAKEFRVLNSFISGGA